MPAGFFCDRIVCIYFWHFLIRLCYFLIRCRSSWLCRLCYFLLLLACPVCEIFVQYVEERCNENSLHVLVIHVSDVIEDTDLVTFQEVGYYFFTSLLVFISYLAHDCDEAFQLLIGHHISFLQ